MTRLISSVSPRQVEFTAYGKARASATSEFVRSKITGTYLDTTVATQVQTVGFDVQMAVNDGAGYLVGTGSFQSTVIQQYDGTTRTFGANIGVALYINQIAAANGTICIAKRLSATGTGNIIRSTDHGSTFTSPTLPLAATWHYITTSGDGRWMCISTGGEILYSSDDGITWVQRTNTTLYGEIWYANNVWITSPSYNTSIARSEDDGSTWTTVDTGGTAGGAACSVNNLFVKTMTGDGQTVSVSTNGRVWRHYTPKNTAFVGRCQVYINGIYYFGPGAWCSTDFRNYGTISASSAYDFFAQLNNQLYYDFYDGGTQGRKFTTLPVIANNTPTITY